MCLFECCWCCLQLTKAITRNEHKKVRAASAARYRINRKEIEIELAKECQVEKLICNGTRITAKREKTRAASK